MRASIFLTLFFGLFIIQVNANEYNSETLEVLSIDPESRTVTLLRASSENKIIDQKIKSVHLKDCILTVKKVIGKTVIADSNECPSFDKLQIADHFDYTYVSRFQFDKTKYLAIPVLLRLEGVSTSFNILTGARNIWRDQLDLYLAGALGDNQNGAIFYLNRIPSPIKQLNFEFGLGYLKNLDFEVSYTRGFEDDQAVIQNLDMYGLIAKANLNYYDNKLLSTLLIGQTHTTINKFKDLNNNLIQLPKLDITPIDATILQLATNYFSSKEAKNKLSGVSIGLAVNALIGRSGQSNEASATVSFATYQPIYLDHHITYFAMVSDAFILESKNKYTNINNVKNELKTDCSGLSGNEQEKCNNLNNSLAQYIVTNNKYGMARPLGGNTMLRAFREFRFRAAYTRYMGFEYQLPLYKKGEQLKLNWVTAAEVGFASDYPSKIFDKSIPSLSTGLWLYHKEFPLRLEYGSSGENQAWFLSVQRPF